MKNNKYNLCKVQAHFIDYINNNLSQNKRVIFYKHKGHFGLEYSIKTYLKKAELITFTQLKTKTGKNIFFRILNILSAIVTFIINEKDKGDARTTVSSILNNLENIYLGIDKEKEYLKYLNVKKLKHKNSRIKHVIRIEDADIETENDIACLRLLVKLIKKGNINNTLLLISGIQINLLNLDNEEIFTNSDWFELSIEDLKFIVHQYNLNISDSVYNNIELIKSLGIQFLLDNYKYFIAFDEDIKDITDWIGQMDWLIKQIINKNNQSRQEIYPLLEFSSFFEKSFNKIEIQDFKENQLNAEKLNTAERLSLLYLEKNSVYATPTYTFKINAFKDYFNIKYNSDLEPLPKYIFEYFRKKFPFEYVPIVKILHSDSSFIDDKEKQSLLLIAFYFQNIEKGVSNEYDIISFFKKNSTAYKIINTYLVFKSNKPKYGIDLNQIVDNLDHDIFDPIATCSAYVIILQFLKENYAFYKSINFHDVLLKFKASIFNIFGEHYYEKYWKIHFECQYLALSLEDEKESNKFSRRILQSIKDEQKDENFNNYISLNNLRGFTRLDLLAYSLGYDDAGNILENLYNSSEESTILKELARINYSAYLIENKYYDNAYNILKKGNIDFIKNINLDTFCGFLNNMYITKWKLSKISIKNYINLMEKLIFNNISPNDKLIITNNLAVAYLQDINFKEKGEEILLEISETGNPYNSFIASHNLLAYYFETDNQNCYNKIYKKINYPKLFSSDKTFFQKKFKSMKDNIGIKKFSELKNICNTIACYNELYLISSIERWFE